MVDHPTLPFNPDERWHSVVGWEGLYEVSSLGRVWSKQRKPTGKRGGLLKPQLRGHLAEHRYLSVTLYRDGVATQRPVHQLVAEAFIGPRPPGCEVCHGPAGRLENRVENLRYGTTRENSMDRFRDGTVPLGEQHKRSKLTVAEVLLIRQRYEQGATMVALGREFGVVPGTIAFVVTRKTWKHVA